MSLHFAHYDFVRVHKTLRMTPAISGQASSGIMSFGGIGRTCHCCRGGGKALKQVKRRWRAATANRMERTATCMKKSALPTSADLKEAAAQGRLMDVILPTGQRVADLPERQAGVSFYAILPNGKTLGRCNRKERAEISKFFESLDEAMEIHRQVIASKTSTTAEAEIARERGALRPNPPSDRA